MQDIKTNFFYNEVELIDELHCGKVELEGLVDFAREDDSTVICFLRVNKDGEITAVKGIYSSEKDFDILLAQKYAYKDALEQIKSEGQKVVVRNDILIDTEVEIIEK
ncbi:MAG: hypothetical protein H0Z24_05445 [Thermosipho sp. (in: Bacteria)]|nr:hypothetical protein [Thermosipho sp. (in: thermotogales)]